MAAVPELVTFDAESEESDQEFLLTSRQLRYTPSIEDFHYEIDVARYYERVLNVNLRGGSSKSSRVAKISRAIQTEPDVSGIPPSLLKAQWTLVDEIHTRIGNLIKCLFPSPQPAASEFQRLKFFEYVDGFWQSKYIPNIKVPASEIDSCIHSGRLKWDLNQLFLYAEKLKNIAPCLDDHECESSGQNPQRTEQDELWNDQASVLKKLRPTKAASSGINIAQQIVSTSEKFSLYSNSVKSGSSSNSSLSGKSSANAKEVSCRSKIPHRPKQCGWGDMPKGCRHEVLSVSKKSAYRSSTLAAESMGNSERCTKVSCPVAKNEVVGNRARRPLTPIADSGDGKTGTSRGDVCVRPKSTLHRAAGQQRKEQENCQKAGFPPVYKNFIKRNILSVREAVIRPRANSGRIRSGCLNI